MSSLHNKNLGLILFGSVTILSTLIARYKKKKSNKLDDDFIIYNSNDLSWRNMVSFKSSKDCKIELTIINNFKEEFIMCWVNGNGQLKHFYRISDGSINDGSVKNYHTEYSQINHSFVLFLQPLLSTIKLPCTLSEICKEVRNFIFAFHYFILIEIFYFCFCKNKNFLCIIRPNIGNKKYTLDISKNNNNSNKNIKVNADISTEELVNDDIIDNSMKKYNEMILCGFKIFYEEDVFIKYESFKNILIIDLENAKRLIPDGICQKLLINTPIWINTSLTFGHINKPIIGHSMCYNPKEGGKWLINNGMNENKSGGVEIYCPKDYLSSRDLWGNGGLIIHEFSHAFHNKFCLNGYDNEIIQNAYNIAMSKSLYDNVNVHGKQGLKGKIKAYACSNCMEFFAELSVAYLCCDDNIEFNKWFPHNRNQLKLHDIDTFNVLANIWG